MIVARAAELERMLARPPSNLRGCLIYGRDRSAVREIADRWARKIATDPDDPFGVARLTDADLDADPVRLVDELAALAMTGVRRLIRLRLAADRPGPERVAAEGLRAHLAGELNSEAFFLIEAGTLERGSGLRKIAEGAPDFVAAILYDDDAGDVARMAREALARERIVLSAPALERFVARLPHDRGVARQEIERLVLFVGPGRASTIDVDELDDFLGVEPDANLLDAAAEAFGGRLRDAHANWRRAAAEGETGVAGVRAIGLQLGRLRRASFLVAAGKSPSEAAKAAGVFWKQEREFVRQLGRWTPNDLESLQSEVFTADRGCKQAGGLDQLLAERLLMAVAGKARRLGL